MENKTYLDSVGLQELVDWINLQLRTIRDNQTTAIDLLYKTDGTPGSIQQMIDDAISKIDISDLLQGDSISLYGGSATEVMENEVIIYGGSANKLI